MTVVFIFCLISPGFLNYLSLSFLFTSKSLYGVLFFSAKQVTNFTPIFVP